MHEIYFSFLKTLKIKTERHQSIVHVQLHNKDFMVSINAVTVPASGYIYFEL